MHQTWTTQSIETLDHDVHQWETQLSAVILYWPLISQATLHLCDVHTLQGATPTMHQPPRLWFVCLMLGRRTLWPPLWRYNWERKRDGMRVSCCWWAIGTNWVGLVELLGFLRVLCVFYLCYIIYLISFYIANSIIYMIDRYCWYKNLSE